MFQTQSFQLPEDMSAVIGTIPLEVIRDIGKEVVVAGEALDDMTGKDVTPRIGSNYTTNSSKVKTEIRQNLLHFFLVSNTVCSKLIVPKRFI